MTNSVTVKNGQVTKFESPIYRDSRRLAARGMGELVMVSARAVLRTA